jgi:hypothetical protein
MTLNEYEQLTDTDKAFLKLEGRCDGCGCKLKDQIFIAHSEWCAKKLQVIWPGFKKGEIQITSSYRRQGKSVFANMVNQLNKTFRKQYENTNS